MRVAFIGSMGSGKTEAAKLLAEGGFTTLSFATPVKQLAANLMTDIESNYAKVVGVRSTDWDIDKINIWKGDPRIRHLLQFIGTELGREFYNTPEIWVEVMREKIRTRPYPYMLVDDCRFPNEAEMLKEEGFIICRINRNRQDIITHLVAKAEKQGTSFPEALMEVQQMLRHPSETSLDGWPADVVIENNGTIEEFRSNLIKILDIE